MKKIMSFLIAVIACLLVGCATTTTTDTFRFQVRELELILGEEKSLDIIMGDFSETEEIVAEQVNSTDESGTVEVLETKSGLVRIKATGVGEVEFRAYIKNQTNVKDTIIINVVNEKVDYLRIESDKTNDKGKIEIKIDEEATIKVTSSPVIENIEYVWESSNSDIFTVDSTGKITGINKGSGYVYVYEKNDPTLVAKKEVVVNYLDTVKIVTDKEVYEIKVGEEVQITAQAYNAYGTTYGVDQAIKYTKTATGISITADGVVKGVKAGEYSVNVISGSVKKTIKVVVTKDAQ